MKSMQKIKSFLKRYPRFYNFIKSRYYDLRFNLKENILGTKVQKEKWATKHIHEGDEWIKQYWNLINHSHRQFLMNRLSKLYPFDSILEVGSNCGPNLFLLAKKYPHATIKGIDINPLAVQRGSEWFAKEDISNVKLLVGEASNLGQFKDKSFDIVFTDAVLIYVGKDEIRNVIKEMIRVARSYLVLVEWHYFNSRNKDPYGLGVHHYSLWKRDYKALLKQFVPEDNIHITKIPDDLWPEEEWKEFGVIIEVKLD